MLTGSGMTELSEGAQRLAAKSRALATSRTNAHTCHAEQCEVRVPPKIFMCKKHWYTLPKALRDEVWLHYSVGQEMRMNPTPEYLNVATRCVRFVAVKEGLIPVGKVK